MEPYQQLEIEWAKSNDLDPAGMVACSSGTAALHLALEAFRLPAGSEVLVPDFTMIACARAVTLAGLTPVFVDCDERLLMDCKLLKTLDKDKVWTAMMVHVYGRRGDVDGLTAWAAENLRWRPLIIEDLAEAHGVKPHSATDAACFSFYKNKIVAGEEGGAVWFRNPEHAALARQLRSLGFTEAHDFQHVPRGHNYRMSNAHAKLILDGFTNGLNDEGEWIGPANSASIMERQVSLRRQIEGWYDAACPDEWRMPARDAVWVYDLRIPWMTSDRQDATVKALNEAGIAARHGFKPATEQEEYRGYRRVPGSAATYRAGRLAREVIYLPVQPGRTTEGDCRRAFEVIRG